MDRSFELDRDNFVHPVFIGGVYLFLIIETLHPAGLVQVCCKLYASPVPVWITLTVFAPPAFTKLSTVP
jgi:hypothetical protein